MCIRDRVQQLFSEDVSIASNGSVTPDLKGLTPMEAISVLEPMGLTVVIKGKGKVKKQSIKAGASFKINQKIVLILS